MLSFKENKKLAEFYGVLLGDGCISKHKIKSSIKYAIRIDGNSLVDGAYYKYLKSLIKDITGRELKIGYRKKCNGIYLVLYHKNFASFLHHNLNFPYGKKLEISIPKVFQEEPYINHLLRGFFDTDGCLYFTKNNSAVRFYPIIELSTHNRRFLNQLMFILNKKGFKVKISFNQDSIKLHGKTNVRKWMEEIGSNNIDKYSKFLYWEKFGYCPKINELPLEKRLEQLKMGPIGFEPTATGSPMKPARSL